MKIVFHFKLKSLFVLKIFKFLSWLSGQLEKQLGYGAFTLQFSDNFLKIWFQVNGVNNCFIIFCIFSSISFWRESIFFPSFFWNQNRLGFKKILEINLSDKSIVYKKGWNRNVMVCLHNFQLFRSFQMVETSKYSRSIFFVPRCKTLLISKTVSYFLLICPAGTTSRPLQMP